MYDYFPGIVYSEVTAVPAVDWEGHSIIGIRATYIENSQNAQHTPLALSISAARQLLIDLTEALELV